MAHNERHEELVALHALGSLGADPELERHLGEGCPICEEHLHELRQAASVLAFAAPTRRPSRAVRDRVLASLGPAPAPSVREITRPARTRQWWLLAAAAALLLFFIADRTRLSVQRDSLQEELAAARARLVIAEREAARGAQTGATAAELASRLRSAEAELARRDLRARVLESDDVRMLFLGGRDPQPRAQGKVFWSDTARRGFVVVGNLQPLPADRQYQLWVFERGKPVDAGVFDVDAEGRALFESKDLSGISGAENFAVTIEPRGGLPQPSGPIVLLGSPSSG
ncbi:MAG: anti-sigma factor domain-containing protein [Thermoanaerobaculia bacterium]